MSTTDRPEQITVCLDTTPGAHRTDSDEIGWWLPIIGPTATILAYTFARHTEPSGTIWETSHSPASASPATAPALGKPRPTRTFGLAQFHATDILTVRTMLPGTHRTPARPAPQTTSPPATRTIR
jgi:hypothetical protein